MTDPIARGSRPTTIPVPSVVKIAADAVIVGGRYALEGRLGEGGMGQVYRARHLQLGKQFALKVIRSAFAGDAEARARFNQEAKLASSISHPNIVSVVDFGEDEAIGAYMVMELVEGEVLVPPGTGPLPVRRVCDVLSQVADAVAHIHKENIVHGDIKAENVLLGAESAGPRRRRVVRLLDFGLARSAGVGTEESLNGSPHYIAPERALGAAPSTGADVYAIGVLAYLMLTGTMPFEGEPIEILHAHVEQAPESPSRRRGEELDPSLEALILRALAKDPAARHADAAAFRYELNTVMDMLDIGRRRVSGPIRISSGAMAAVEDPRQKEIGLAFDKSRLPQALLDSAGVVSAANRAYVKLLGANDLGDVEGKPVDESTLATAMPGLMRDLHRVLVDQTPRERRATVDCGPERPQLELVAWITPTWGEPTGGLHLIIRVSEIATPPR
jgi:serine/threonine protein kinase